MIRRREITGGRSIDLGIISLNHATGDMHAVHYMCILIFLSNIIR